MEDDALESALGALRHRDRTSHELDRRLAERGFDEPAREAALDTLRRTGLLDDGRYALNRATALAARCAGDELIRHDLLGAGVDPEAVETALASLEPEVERARRIVERRGPGPRTARYLRGRGYSYESATAAVATAEHRELP